MTDEIKTIASLYAPIDGMNEKGVCISVNYIEDSSKINQDTSNKDLTTTTAIRLILNKAADVNEAIELLEQYDMHGSMGYMIHFAIADSKGKSVVVEYINNEMKVLDTPVVTNFYMNEGEKNGIGTQQSHERYEILMNIIQEKQNKMSMEDVKAALESVCKKHYNDGETTEWSVIFNQSTGEINYYHREDYNNVYTFKLDMSNE
jgi:predicted choloylglycine hydrolase